MTHEDWHHDDVDPTECKHEAVPCQAKIATCDFTKEEAEGTKAKRYLPNDFSFEQKEKYLIN